MTLADYAAKVKALEEGGPQHPLTLAESLTQLEGLILRENWQTPEERDAAEVLLVRLALLRRKLGRQPSGEDQAGASG